MCFSATASFATSTGLFSTSLYIAHKSKLSTPLSAMIALIPLAFGIQQAVEGVVWISLLENNPILGRSASLVYLFFVLLFWPTFCPILGLFYETRKIVRFIFYAIVFAGFTEGIYQFVPLILRPDLLNTFIYNQCIFYDFRVFPILNYATRMSIYLICCPLCLLLCRQRNVKVFGLLGFIFYLISLYFYTYTLTSVWCFFAAFLSFFSIKALPKTCENSEV